MGEREAEINNTKSINQSAKFISRKIEIGMLYIDRLLPALWSVIQSFSSC
jgi:hypothetical protein